MIRCLICESKAILTRDVAKGIALLVSLADSALQGGSGGGHRYPNPGVAKYHFGGFRYLCLRCGSLFDEPGTEEASEPAM